MPAAVRALELAGVIAVSSRKLPQAMLAEIHGFAQIVVGESDQNTEAIVKQAVNA